MKRTILALMIAVVVAGCNSPKKIHKPVSKVVMGKSIPRPTVQNLRGYEIVKEYGLGRRIDPNNPNIMYGPCKMYVVRRSPSWNLRPNSPAYNPSFKKLLNSDYSKSKTELKKHQALQNKAIYQLKNLEFQLLKNQQALKRINKKYPKIDLQPSLEIISKDLGKIKRRMAELQ